MSSLLARRESQSPDLPSFFVNYEAEASYENEDPQNGLILNGFYLPEEIIINIFTFIEPEDILDYSPVCRKWNRLIKSFPYWSETYKRHYKRKAKKLPWYVFYCLFSTDVFSNILMNTTGLNGLDFWDRDSNFLNNIMALGRNPGCAPMPVVVNDPELPHAVSFFAIFGACCVRQSNSCSISDNNLLNHVFNYYKPHVYLSEWTAGQKQCNSLFKMTSVFRRNDDDLDDLPCAINLTKDTDPIEWKKIELLVTEYPDNIDEINFEHEGCDLLDQGTRGCNMTCAVMKCVFDSMESLPIDENGRTIPKTYSEFKFTTNGLRKEDWPDYEIYCPNRSERYFVPFGDSDFDPRDMDNLDIFDEYSDVESDSEFDSDDDYEFFPNNF